jgi:hypothetical protein
VSYTLNGTPEQYRRKVYGDAWQGKVSPEDFVGEHQAWDIRETYRRLWDAYGFTVQELEVRNGQLVNCWLYEAADKIISTIPAPSLCEKTDHTFTRHTIYANGSVKQYGVPENVILCDGTGNIGWYRISNVFGYRTVEWTEQAGQYLKGRAKVTKPLKTDCVCHPEVIRAGRYGEWDKSVLVHQVFNKVTEAIQS